MVDVTVHEIEQRSRNALLAHGASPEQATPLARAIAQSEATGNSICGLIYLDSYCRQLRSGRVDGQAVPVLHQPRAGIVQVDAGHGFSQPAFLAGLDAALAAARLNGTASLAIAHAHGCASLGFFTAAIARAGLIGLGFANASAMVAPPGGRVRAIGTNPMAVSVPDGQGGLSMHMDQSTSAVALGRVRRYEQAGKPIPDGWAMDATGRPTRDPAAALDGVLMSMGGTRGWGLGLLVELLAACMTGSSLSQDLVAPRDAAGPRHDLGQFYLLIDPGCAPDFTARFARVAALVNSDDGARLPGQYWHEAAQAAIPDDLWSLTLALSDGR